MILDSQESGRGFFMYTGRGPSGSTHIGHLVPWAFARWLQDRFGTTIYFQITDDEKFYAKPDLTLDQTRELAYDNALDFAALGFDPLKTHILIDTLDISKRAAKYYVMAVDANVHDMPHSTRLYFLKVCEELSTEMDRSLV